MRGCTPAPAFWVQDPEDTSSPNKGALEGWGGGSPWEGKGSSANITYYNPPWISLS